MRLFGVTSAWPEHKMHTGLSLKYISVLIDDNLNWKQQIKEQCSKVARGSWALNQLKHFVDEQTLRSVYHCLIYSDLQYCIPVSRLPIVGGLLQNQH